MEEIKFYKRVFIVSGLADYKDVNDGVLLIEQEAINQALPTLIKKPVIIGHGGKEKVGEIVDCYFSAEKDGFICGFNVWDKQAQDLLDSREYHISCSYDILERGTGGVYHNINYDEQALAITFKNIAIVKNPRYQEAREVINSINNDKEEEMSFFSKKNEIKENAEDFVIFKGEKLPLEEFGRVLLEEVALHKGKPVADSESEEIENETETEEDNKIENEEVDKRKDIVDVGGFLKSKGLSDEDIRYVMKLMEEASYNKSLAGSKDNSKCNETQKEKQEETGEKELEKKVKPIENSIKEAGKNYNFSSFKTRNERIKESNKSFYC